MSAVFSFSQRKLNFHAAQWRVLRKNNRNGNEKIDAAKVKDYISEHRRKAEYVKMSEDFNDGFMEIDQSCDVEKVQELFQKKLDAMRREFPKR